MIPTPPAWAKAMSSLPENGEQTVSPGTQTSFSGTTSVGNSPSLEQHSRVEKRRTTTLTAEKDPQVALLDDQQGLLKAQVHQLSKDLTSLRKDYNELKNEVVTKEVEQVLEKMFAEHEDHREKIIQLSEALESLKDSAVSKEIEPVIEKMFGWHEEHRASVKSVSSRLVSVEERIAKTESVVVEQSNLHVELGTTVTSMSKDLEAAKTILADLEASLNSCAKAESLTAGLKRVDYLEQLLGESVGNHANHKASMENRLEVIERQLGESADNHSSHKATMEQRLEVIERQLGESADNHSSHKTTVGTRLDFIEKLIGDNADKHAKDLAAHSESHNNKLSAHAEKHAKDLSVVAGEVSAIETTLNGHSATLNGCAKSEHHETLLERVDYLEKLLGESADTHSNHKATMESRLEFIEKMIGDNAEKHAKSLSDHADKHAKELAAYAEKHGLTLSEHDKKIVELAKSKAENEKVSGLETAMNGYAKSEQHATMLQRMEYLEKMLGESADDHSNHKATLETRLEYIEKTMGDNAEKHAKDLEGHAARHANELSAYAEKHAKKLSEHDESLSVLGTQKADNAKVTELEADMTGFAKNDQHATLLQRMEYVENMIGESADHHSNHKASMETRLEFLEKTMGDNAEKHAKDLAAHAEFIEKKIGNNAEMHAKSLSDHAEKHAKDLAVVAGQKADNQKLADLEAAKAAQHSTLLQRVDYLEKSLGESADAHGNHKTTMEKRLEFIEKMIGDNADKHAKELLAHKAQIGEHKNQIGDLSAVKADSKTLSELQAAFDGCAKSEHHASLLKRVDFLEGLLGESADKHDKLRTSMETRVENIEAQLSETAASSEKSFAQLGEAMKGCAGSGLHDDHATLRQRVDFLEQMLGESADKHDSHKSTLETRLEYIEAQIAETASSSGKSLAALEDAMKGCAKSDLHEHHASLGQRVDFLEKMLGESADKHDSHKNTMEERLEYLEKLMGESADAHGSHKSSMEQRLEQLEASLNGSVSEINGALALCAKSDGHNSLQERVAYLEKFTGESADKHDNHKSSINTRLEYIEDKLGDSSETHAKEIQDAKNKLQDLHTALMSCAKTDHASSLEQRMDYLEKFLGESADNHTNHKASIETRIEYLETQMGDSASRHAEQIAAANASLGNLQQAVSECATSDHHDSIQQRVDYIEKIIGDSAEKHERDMNGHKNGLNEHANMMQKRLAELESGLRQQGEQHKDKLGNLENMISTCVRSELHDTLIQRLDALEKAIGGQGREVELAHAKLREHQEKMSGDYQMRDKNHTSLEERLVSMDRKLNDFDNNLRKLHTLEAGHLKLKNQNDELTNAFREEKASRESNIHALDDKTMKLETAVNEVASKYGSEIDMSNARLREVSGKLDQYRSLVENHRSTIDQRLSYMENLMADTQGTKFAEVFKDIEQRILYLQDDQKRHRDVLEATLNEQLRIEQSSRDAQAAQMKEQWDREMKARESHQNNYRNLLDHERTARERADQSFLTRIQGVENNLVEEMKRLWTAVDGHTHEYTVNMPDTRSQSPVARTRPMIMNRVAVQSPRLPQYTIVQPPLTVTPPVITTSTSSVPPVLPLTAAPSRMVSGSLPTVSVSVDDRPQDFRESSPLGRVTSTTGSMVSAPPTIVIEDTSDTGARRNSLPGSLKTSMPTVMTYLDDKVRPRDPSTGLRRETSASSFISRGGPPPSTRM